MSFLEHLNSVQQQAVQAIDGPVMIVAGAGSGKTRVLTYRVAFCVQSGIRPYEILALTFTNKAAKEMKSRIINLVGIQSRDVWMGTFHSIFARLLRIEAAYIGYDRNFTIYDSDDTLNVIRDVMRALNISTQQFHPNAIRSRISGAKNSLIDPIEFTNRAGDLFEEKTAQVYTAYEKRLHEMNAMDFDDLIVRPIGLFEHHQNILEKYQHRFKYISIDEYQDTNRAQYRLINLLAAKFRNICVVGDDAQSIYAFRGADIRNILDFEKDYPDCRMFRLEQNYRSTKTILAAAGGVIKNNKRQIRKTLWTENPEGEPITLLECEDEKEEGIRIVHNLQHDGQKYKISFNQIAVLYRTNAQSRSIEDAMRRAGIPYVIVGGVEFYRRKEIKDVLAYLRVIANPKDEESLLRIINTPTRGISQQTVARFREAAIAHRCDLFTILSRVENISDLSDRARTAVQRFSQMISKYIGMKTQMSASELARSVVDDIGILQELKREGTPEAIVRWENIQELLSAITEYCAEKPSATLENFLEEVSLIADVDRWDDQRNTVTLMTLHAAKGLEFPVVFVAGLEEGLFPISVASMDQSEIEEERRLFYVGITRAMKKLYLSYAHTRYRFGSMSFQARSRFVDEVDEGLVEKEIRHTRPPKSEQKPAAILLRKPQHRRSHTADQTYNDVHPDYENESQESVDLHVGVRVVHDAFGEGRIVSLSGKGENARASVAFDSVGLKQLLIKYANLRIV
ncbi:MAG: UvrD-helicase domain-containing protein [Bacteroidota bacterium]